MLPVALPLGVQATVFSAPSSGVVVEVPSRRPVLSPQFEPRAEAELRSTLRDVAGALPGARRGVVAVEEFRGPWGVPDLAALSPARMQQRLAAQVPPLLSAHDCRLVVSAARWTEPAELGARAGVSSGQVLRYVRRLVRLGALIEEGGRVRRAPGMVTMGHLWALEAKVDDWQGGLSQAHRYRLWADGAVLVLGRARVGVDVLAEQARLYRVGLVVGGRWVVRPRVVLTDDATRLHASEHMLAALIGADQQPAASA